MKRFTVIPALAATLLAFGCANDQATSGPTGGTDGSLVAAFGFDGPTHDVEFMGYAVYAGEVDCADPGAEPVAGATVPMEEEFLPLWLEADGSGGDMHPFADALFVLQPGDYTVCATPLDGELVPSEHCAPVSGSATVMPEMTTEIVLYSQCLGDPTGALDVVVALNDPPHIDNLTIEESKFITQCENGTITVFASDPNGDALTYAWEIVDGPGAGTFTGEGATVVFNGEAVGEYTLKVTVTDGHGGMATLSFPVHVSGACCFKELAYEDFSGPTLEWTLENSAAECAWQIVGPQGSSASDALYYGNTTPGVENICPGVASSGTATSELVSLAAGYSYTLSANVYLDLEQNEDGGAADSNNFDLFEILIPGGGSYQLFEKNGQDEPNPTPNGVWLALSWNVSAFAGSDIAVSFFFNTVDGQFNDREGIYVDDVTFAQDCALACESDADCDDGFDFSLDTCVDGTCAYELAQ